MSSDAKVYRQLRRHLDKQPVSFPKTKSQAELKILRRLFTPKQAKLAMAMNYQYQSPGEIAKRYNKARNTAEEVKIVLEEMVEGRAIYWKNEKGKDLYALPPLVVGTYELNMDKLTPDFQQDFQEYFDSRPFEFSIISTEFSQMRTIPINEAITPEHNVAPYNDVRSLVLESPGPFMIAECICRLKHANSGETCQVTSRKETCLSMGSLAKQMLRVGVEREISKQEALAILQQNAEDGLVFQPSGGKIPEFICSCCGCCCGMLRNLKKLPRPAEFWTHHYFVSVNTDDCIGCGNCVDACNVNAIKIIDNVSVINGTRCIGCGQCVLKCPSEAIKLKKNEQMVEIPETNDQLYNKIMEHKPSKIGLLTMIIRMFRGKKWHIYHET